MTSGGGAGFGEKLSEGLVGYVKLTPDIEEPACLVECLRKGVENRDDLHEIATRHQLFGSDETPDQDVKTTTWRCAQEYCRAQTTAIIDDSDPGGKIISLEFPSRVPAIPSMCAENPEATFKR